MAQGVHIRGGMRRRSGNHLNCRDGMCGGLDCTTCYGLSALRYRLQVAHEDEHQTPERTCRVCVMARYEAKRKVAGLPPVPRMHWETAWRTWEREDE